MSPEAALSYCHGVGLWMTPSLAGVVDSVILLSSVSNRVTVDMVPGLLCHHGDVLRVRIQFRFLAAMSRALSLCEHC